MIFDIDYSLLVDEDSVEVFRVIELFNKNILFVLKKNELYIVIRFMLDLV